MGDVYEYKKVKDETEYSFKFEQFRTGTNIADREYVVEIKPKENGSVYANVWETTDGDVLFEGTLNKHHRFKNDDSPVFGNMAEIEVFAKQILKFAVECKYNIRDYASALV